MASDIPDEKEITRLASLHALNVLDSEPELSFSGLVEVAAEICGVPISLISLIDEDRQWFKANTGLPDTHETPRDIAFCAHAIEDINDLLEIPDTLKDSRFKQNPLVTGEPNIRFYAGAKLTLSCGAAIGTLCVIGNRPKKLSSTQRKFLRSLANTVTDLLEARRTTEQLAASESRFRGLCDASPLGIFSSDNKGACNFTNKRCLEMLGKSEQETLGWGWQESIHHEDKQTVLSQLQKTLQEQHIFNREFRIVQNDGVVKHVRAIAAPTYTATGTLSGSIGIIEDTTISILKNRALSEERSRLTSIIKGTGTGTWEWNLQTSEFRANQRFKDISGHPDITFTHASESRSLIHPDDLEKSDIELQRHINGETKRFDYERRIKHSDGNCGWVVDRGQIVTRTPDGKAEWMFGTRLDINERKLQAEQLTTAREQMATDQRRTAVTQERLRLARDMHDTLAHSLMALLTQIRVVRKLRKTLPELELENELESLEGVAVSGISEARAAITQMRHNDVNEIGVDAAIQSLCDRFAEHTGIQAKININKHESRQVHHHAETLFRITEAALHNVERHSEAKHVSINLSSQPLASPALAIESDHQSQTYILCIKDDGVGFLSSENQPGHYGIRGMHEQAALIDGKVTVQSKPNQGTTVSIEFSA